MPPKSKRWQIAPRVSSLVVARFGARQLHPALIQVLYNRGITTPEQVDAFLSPDALIGDPFELYGMTESVERIRRAIHAGEMIAVYGDFDVDGVTATVLLVQALQSLGAQVQPYIPHRIDEGYGLNRDALTQLKEQGVQIVITVDCGIRSLPEIAFGKQIGLDMIITDHHAPGDQLPDSFATINPKQALCKYPFKDLSGAGVAFKLAQGLLRADERAPLDKNRPPMPEDALVDLVALGTVADLVPLIGENRALVKRGLAQLRGSERPGIQALIRQAAIKPQSIDAGTIGYTLGPRLNAAGRLESALMAFNLLATQYPGEADDLAIKLEETNRERQRLTTEMTLKARDAVMSRAEQDRLLFVSASEFPEGIVGLIASRLSEEFYRPAVAVHYG
ncbi:MAG TPA: single-stranded-DNA-specific exonuclease RecJ, partial [Anaerolineae bacterium]